MRSLSCAVFCEHAAIYGSAVGDMQVMRLLSCAVFCEHADIYGSAEIDMHGLIAKFAKKYGRTVNAVVVMMIRETSV